jgi:ATP-binding cassette subfamily B protein
VDFAYSKDSEKPVLKDINFSIRSGETIGIIGGTGSAKTSLVNLVDRMYDVTEGRGAGGRQGRAQLRRGDPAQRGFRGAAEERAVLRHHAGKPPLGRRERRRGDCAEACRLACADEFISKMPEGYNTRIEQGGTNISGGQKQRLCIARALLKRPKILILDDSTSAVDTATDAKYARPSGSGIPNTTKLIISQRVASVMDADRILVLDNGEVSGFGTHEELMAPTPYTGRVRIPDWRQRRLRRKE